MWPVSIAPYPVHLVRLPGVEAVAEQLYEDLHSAGIDVLMDDRDSRAGVKFVDADLIGLPIRLTVGERSLESGGVEFKRRDQAEREIVPLNAIIDRVQAELLAMQTTLDAQVIEVDYKP
jgi:prolyl-tRNA synthetase